MLALPIFPEKHRTVLYPALFKRKMNLQFIVSISENFLNTYLLILLAVSYIVKVQGPVLDNF